MKTQSAQQLNYEITKDDLFILSRIAAEWEIKTATFSSNISQLFVNTEGKPPLGLPPCNLSLSRKKTYTKVARWFTVMLSLLLNIAPIIQDT